MQVSPEGFGVGGYEDTDRGWYPGLSEEVAACGIRLGFRAVAEGIVLDAG